MRLNDKARAKVNLTLAVLGRRGDGYHVLDSLVAFADIADELSLEPGPSLSLAVSGPMASGAGAPADNLVLKAAGRLAGLVPGLRLGHFRLIKHLPAAAGIGGGSSDAAAALRLLARANGLAVTDGVVIEAARRTGSDVCVCLEAQCRWMRGAGEILSLPVELQPLPIVLLNPGIATPTAEVFRALGLVPDKVAAYDEAVSVRLAQARDSQTLIRILGESGNHLEPPAIALRPVIADALALMRAQIGCGLARMSGSGATVFGLFDDDASAQAAATSIGLAQPAWWVRKTTLAGGGDQGVS